MHKLEIVKSVIHSLKYCCGRLFKHFGNFAFSLELDVKRDHLLHLLMLISYVPRFAI
jgi:hypothetical protein